MPPDIKPPHDSKPSADTKSASSVTDANPAKRCLACGASGVKNRCGGCRQVYFCDLACQKRIWTAHRPTCQQATPPTPLTTVAVPSDQHSAPSPTPAPPTLPMAPEPTRDASPRKKSVVLVPPPPTEQLALDANSSASKPKSKKKNKKNKKPRSNSLHAPASAAMAPAAGKHRAQSLGAKKRIMWGVVHAREFTRFPGGGGAVPYDGSWALGLGAPVADVQLGSVLELDEWRRCELEARAKELSKSQRARVREGETRQFDYKAGARNPLFGRLSERERKKLFSEAELRQLREAEDMAHAKNTKTSRRKLSAEMTTTADFACVASEQLHEFAVIRDSRDDGCGCACGDLVKKVAKMNLKKLQAFVAARGAKPAATKPEALAQAKALALREKNCSTQADCACVQNGVSCHASVCVGCAGDCFNPHAQYAYEKERVREYRREMIAKWKSHESHQSIAVA